MKLATLRIPSPKTRSEARDGVLLVAAKDSKRAARVPENLYPNLLSAIEDWKNAKPKLEDIARQLEEGRWTQAIELRPANLMAPLPRTYSWLDGSAYVQHIVLVRKARGAEPPEDLYTVPLMYQGISDNLLGPEDDIPLIDEADGLDLEAEVGVIVDDVPMGTKAKDAAKHVLLIVLMNDVSLRNLIPRELKAGFGFFHGKPSTAFGPFAVTPDELGTAWKEGRVHLPVESRLNGAILGRPDAGEMHFSFYDLIEHAAKTRQLSAGTIIGGGTVSNKDTSVGSACLAEKRMLEQINAGKAQTPFLKAGDAVEIDLLKANTSICGKIRQKVVPVVVPA